MILKLIQLESDLDLLLIYSVLGCIILAIFFIFKVIIDTLKQRKSHNIEKFEINKKLKMLNTLYNQNYFSEMDFQKSIERLYCDLDVLKSHWLGVQLNNRSKLMSH